MFRSTRAPRCAQRKDGTVQFGYRPASGLLGRGRRFFSRLFGLALGGAGGNARRPQRLRIFRFQDGALRLRETGQSDDGSPRGCSADTSRRRRGRDADIPRRRDCAAFLPRGIKHLGLIPFHRRQRLVVAERFLLRDRVRFRLLQRFQRFSRLLGLFRGGFALGCGFRGSFGLRHRWSADGPHCGRTRPRRSRGSSFETFDPPSPSRPSTRRRRRGDAATTRFYVTRPVTAARASESFSCALAMSAWSRAIRSICSCDPDGTQPTK